MDGKPGGERLLSFGIGRFRCFVRRLCAGVEPAARFAYNRVEPQGAANSPRLSNRFGGLAFCLGLPILSDWELLYYYRDERDNAGDQLDGRRNQSQIGHGVHLLPFFPSSGAWVERGVEPRRLVIRPSMIAARPSAQMACVQRGVRALLRGSSADLARFRSGSIRIPLDFSTDSIVVLHVAFSRFNLYQE